MNCTGSLTPPRPPPPWPSATADPRRSASTWIGNGSMSATPPTSIDAVFNAWHTDRSHGLDAVMLAPTRELVSRLNPNAPRIIASPTPVPRPEGSSWPDGSQAGVGDLIVTRRNDRKGFAPRRPDWVKKR